jgi:hypothetical protein
MLEVSNLGTQGGFPLGTAHYANTISDPDSNPLHLGRISSDANSINLEGLQSPISIKMGGDALDFRLVSCITFCNVLLSLTIAVLPHFPWAG